MDPTAFPAYYPAMPGISQYPYPATSATGAGGRGMIFYPQPMSVPEALDMDRSSPPPDARLERNESF